MRRDRALLSGMADASCRAAVLRVYRFAPPGITLGRAQRPERELDLERCRALGVDWAVRPTGGRAIWHDEDWTFAAVGSARFGPLAGAPREAYRSTARLLASALSTMGLETDLTPGTPGGPGPSRGEAHAAAPCFASSARHELTLRGRKVAGIAQRESAGARLQQGSLLVGPSHLRICEVLQLGEARRRAMRAELEAGSGWLAVGEPLATFEAFAAALGRAWDATVWWREDPSPEAWARAGLRTSAYPVRPGAVDRSKA